MNTAHAFRCTLALRLFALLAASLPAGGTAGCLMSSSCPDNPEPTPGVACFDWPPDAGAGGAGAAAGTGGAGGSGGGGAACPSLSEAQAHIDTTNGLGNEQVRSEAPMQNGQCCYNTIVTPFCEGRPYLVDEVARTAPSTRASSDNGWDAAEAITPHLAGLGADLRTLLAAEWTRDALFEHASVASFGRFALELLAVGAPADLVEEAHRAALDEVRHARLCFALASAYAGEAIGPGSFPFEGGVEVVADLASIAARTVKEGCVGETIAAVIAAEQLACAQDPAVRSVLAVIAADEARHAELAWRTLAWALRVGDARVRQAVTDAFAGALRVGSHAAGGAADARLAAHGRLEGGQLGEAAARAMKEIVRPAAALALAATVPIRSATDPSRTGASLPA